MHPFPRLFLVSLLAAASALLGSTALAAAESAAPAPLAPLEQLARVAADPALAAAREAYVAEARADAGKSLIRRPRDLAGLRASRIPMKYPEQPAHVSALDAAAWETLALSLGDINTASRLSLELPRLAAAATLTGDASLREPLFAQLAEIATWEPLQRSGYSLRNTKTALEPGGEGAWLGTGWMIRAIVESLELTPPDAVPPALRAALDARLEAEIAALVDDWQTKRPWYVRQQAVHSNQWIIPTEGLIRACLHLGRERHPEAYELGVANLLRSLDAQGPDGEYVEGASYAGLTLTGVLSAARAMSLQGDDRVIRHPFLQNFPTWLAHHLQPGGRIINAFNSTHRDLASPLGNVLTRLVADTGSPVALWVLQRHDAFNDTLPGLVARTFPASAAREPALYAHYPMATRLNWRDSWDDATAAGFWMRGGHETDFHDHMDRGHVNFLRGDRALLIEAGTVSYGIPEHATHYMSVAGHNVLQLGDLPPEKLTPAALRRAGQIREGARRAAPITVHRMDAAGGSASVDVSAVYADVVRWVRHVEWDRDGVDVRDEVELARPEIALFRWHLGEPGRAAVTPGEGRIRVGDTVLVYEADAPLAVRVESMPDGTLLPRGVNHHACVVVRTTGPVARLHLRTRVAFADDAR